MKIAVYNNTELYDEGDRHPCSGLVVMRALANAGHEVSLFYDEDIFWQEDESIIQLRTFLDMPETDVQGHYVFPLSGAVLSDPDLIVLKRNEPNPRLLAYLRDAYEHVIPIVNGTNCIETHNKKFCERFSEYMHPTIYSSSIDELTYAIKDFGETILKPINLGRGRGIQKITADDPGLEQKLRTMTSDGAVEIVAQRFSPAVVDGDKRVLAMINPYMQDYVALSTRRAAPGNILCHLCHGGTREALPGITPKERAILEGVTEELIRNKVYMTGIDFIGERLTEINTINPGFTSLSDDEFAALDFDARVQRFFESFYG